MNVSVEAIDMLITRLSNIEINQEKMMDKITENASNLKICPCWLSSIEFYPGGDLKQIFFFSKAKEECINCYPKE